MKVKQAILASMLISSDGFSNFAMNQIRPIMTAGSERKLNIASMVGTDDEVAALRAAAQKAREEAQKLAKVCIRKRFRN